MSRRLITGLLLAGLAMAFGFYLKWRILSPFDPVGWYLQSTSLFAYTDTIGIYIERNVASHPLPYVQMNLEYPPVVGAVMYLASFAPGPRGFLAANYAVLALAGLGTVWAIYSLRGKAKLWIFAATPPLVLYTGLNWDMLAIFFAMASLALFQRGRDGWSGALLALGVWAKLFPALLLPVLVLQRARERNWQGLKAMGSWFGLVSLAVNLPVLFLSYRGWRYVYNFHGSRPPDGGSLWTDFGSLPADFVTGLSLAVVIVGIVIISVTGLRNGRDVAERVFGILVLFVLVDKVSSPQYHLWLMPFLALFPLPLWLLGIFLSMDLVYYWFSFQILFIYNGGQSELAGIIDLVWEPVSLARQLVLLLLFLWTMRRLFSPSDKKDPVSDSEVGETAEEMRPQPGW